MKRSEIVFIVPGVVGERLDPFLAELEGLLVLGLEPCLGLLVVLEVLAVDLEAS